MMPFRVTQRFIRLGVITLAMCAFLSTSLSSARAQSVDLDFGDAPPTYPVLFGANGARHQVASGQPLTLGVAIDAEPNGQPSALATADGNPDEGGVNLGSLFVGASTNIQVTVAGGTIQIVGGFINGWIDFNADNIWAAGEKVINNVFVLSGTTVNFAVNVPVGTPTGITFARFRLTSDGQQGVLPTGLASDGEVEDYAVRICPTPPPPTCCVHLALIVDVSGSMRGAPLAEAVGAATDLVNLMNTPPSLLGLVTFAGGTSIEQPMPGTKAQVIGKLNGLTIAGGGSFMAPAINAAQAELAANTLPGCTDIMIIISDFSASDAPAATAAAAAAKGVGTRIITVGINVAAIDVPFMDNLASSPADSYNTSSPDALRDLFFQLRWKICNEAPPTPCRPPYGPEGSPFDLGDVADSSNHFGVQMTTYSGNVTAAFPTVFDPNTGLVQGPRHTAPAANIYLGAGVSREAEADMVPDTDYVPNIDPPKNKEDQDWYDDGVRFPITLPSCQLTSFQYDVNVVSGPATRYVNVWLDINRDGDWSDTVACFDPARGTVQVPEWAVRDQVLNLGVGVHTVQAPQFNHYDPSGTNAPTWLRISVGDLIAPAPQDGRGPTGGYAVGETEDYLIAYDAASGGFEPGAE